MTANRKATLVVVAAAVAHFVIAYLFVGAFLWMTAAEFESGEVTLLPDVCDWIATILMQPALFLVNNVDLPAALGWVVFALNSLGWGYAIVAIVSWIRRRAGRTSLAAPRFVDFWLGVFAWLWTFAGAYFAISRFRSGEPAMALLGVVFFVAAIGISYSRRWAAIALLTHWTVISAAGVFLLIARGFSARVALSTAMALLFVVMLALRLRAPALLAILLLGAACAEPEFPAQRPEDVARTVNADMLLDEDIEVYEALIAGFAKHGQLIGMPPPMPQYRRPLNGDQVRERSAEIQYYLQPYTEIPAGPAYPVRDYGWMRADGTQSGPMFVPPSAAVDLNARNRKRVSLLRFRPRHLIVHRVESRPHRIVLTLSLPGYSLNRDAALVVVSSFVRPPPFIGTISQIVYLRKTGGGWEVVGEQPRWVI